MEVRRELSKNKKENERDSNNSRKERIIEKQKREGEI